MTPSYKTPPQVETIAEVMERLRLSRATIYNLLDRGDLVSLKVGGRRLITLESVARLLAGPEHQQVARRCLDRRHVYAPKELRFLKAVSQLKTISVAQADWLARLEGRLI